jgi:uncharacterized protein YkwD
MRIRNLVFSLALLFLFLNIQPAGAELLPFYKSTQSYRLGMSGDSVYFLQIYLADFGVYPRNKITGYFGPLTQGAVKAFQLRNNIETTGIVGPKTKQKIGYLVASDKISSAVKVESLPPLMLVATSSEVGNVIVSIATSSELGNYELSPKPFYDLKRLAKEVQDLVNKKRAEFGLNQLYWDDELASVAEEHSLDQTKDNIELTNLSTPCHYPIIRHEGFTHLGYSLKDRYNSRNIKYIYGGENIAMLPTSKELLYMHRTSEPLIECKKVAKFLPGQGTEEVRTALFRSVFSNSLEAAREVSPVDWVNRKWRTYSELAELTVDGWMNSPGHKDNILRKEYTVAGMGIASVNDYLIITHNFVGR